MLYKVAISFLAVAILAIIGLMIVIGTVKPELEVVVAWIILATYLGVFGAVCTTIAVIRRT